MAPPDRRAVGWPASIGTMWAGPAQQETRVRALSPRVRGSSPWRRTPDQASDLVFLSRSGFFMSNMDGWVLVVCPGANDFDGWRNRDPVASSDLVEIDRRRSYAARRRSVPGHADHPTVSSLVEPAPDKHRHQFRCTTLRLAGRTPSQARGREIAGQRLVIAQSP
jgi:hypothetical protein